MKITHYYLTGSAVKLLWKVCLDWKCGYKLPDFKDFFKKYIVNVEKSRIIPFEIYDSSLTPLQVPFQLPMMQFISPLECIMLSLKTQS